MRQGQNVESAISALRRKSDHNVESHINKKLKYLFPLELVNIYWPIIDLA